MRRSALAIVTSIAAIAGTSDAAARRFTYYNRSNTTGVRALDRLIAREKVRLRRLFRVRPYVFIYNDRGRPNAAATLQRVRRGTDGTVLFGRTLMVRELYRGRYASTAVAGIMAHEYAHIVQLRRGAGRVRTVFLELHADCMSGWYLQRSRRGRLTIQPFARSLYQKGDYLYWSRAHHGTPRQRIRALIAGYKAGDLALNQTYKYCISVATRVRG